MILSTEEILGRLRAEQTYLGEHFGVKKIALFGSYARGDFNENSDIDILIEVEKKSYNRRYFLKEYLESVFKKRVDVVYFDSLRPFIRRFVEKDIVYA